MSDEWDKYAVQEDKPADEWSQYAVKEESSVPEKTDYITPAVIGAGALGAATGAGVAINKMVVQPYLTMKQANKDLRNIGNIYGISPKVSESFIPKALQDRMMEKRDAGSLLLSKARNESNTKILDLNKQLSGLNAQATQESSELANIIKSNAPVVYKTATDRFGKMLDSIDNLAQEAGFTMSNKQFSDNVLNSVIEEAQKSGMDSKAIKQLVDARDAILSQSKILDAKGNPTGTNMSLSDAKSVISNITREDPYSPMSAKVREKWAEFLEKESPPQVKPLYEKLNAQYKPFAEARNFVTKLSNSKTGEFDASGLGRYIENYVKKGSDTGIGKLMELLGNGNDLVPKIEGLSDRFGVIKGLKDTKSSIGKILEDAKSSGAKNISTIQENNLKDILNLQRAKTVASEISNIASTASDKLPVNAVGRFIGRTLGVGGKIMAASPLGYIEGKAQEKSAGYNPSDAFQRWFDIKFGSPKTKDREIERLKKDAQEAMII